MHRRLGYRALCALVLAASAWAGCSLVNRYYDIPGKQGTGGQIGPGGSGGTFIVGGFGGATGGYGGFGGHGGAGLPGGFGGGGYGGSGGTAGTAGDYPGMHIGSGVFGSISHERDPYVILGSDDESVMVGTCGVNFDVGTGPLTQSGQDNLFVVKWGGYGQLIFTHGVHTLQGNPRARIDSQANVIVVGSFQTTVDFTTVVGSGGGGGAGTAGNGGGGSAGWPAGPLQSAGGFDIYIAKFDQWGAHLWSRAVGGADDQMANSVAVDSQDNIIIVGQFDGPAIPNFGGPCTGPASPASELNGFVAKLDADGHCQWIDWLGGPNEDAATAVDTDSLNNVFVAGNFETAVKGHNTAATRDVFLTKLDATSGSEIWFRSFALSGVGGSAGAGGGGYDADGLARSLAVDGQDNVVMVGDFSGTMDFGCGAETGQGGGPPQAGGGQVYIGKYNPAGNPVWCKVFGDEFSQAARGVSVSPYTGRIGMVGDFRGTINFGGTTLISNGGSGDNKPGGATPDEVGGGDIFLVVFEGDGVHRWSKNFGDQSPQFGRSVALDPHGWSVRIAGDFFGTVNFGGFDLSGYPSSSDIYDAAFVQ